MKVQNQLHPILTTLVLFYSLQSGASLDFLSKANIEERIRNQIAKTSVGTEVKLQTPEIFNGLTAAIKYKIQSEPSYSTGYFTRIDDYTLQAAVKAGDLIDGLEMPISFEMDKGAQIIFARQFKSQKESLTAAPYTVKNIPLTAQKARENLNVGDFVAFQANLNFILGANYSALIANQLAVNGGTHLYISGNFWVHMFKMPNNKLRIKFIAFRNQGGDATASIDYANGLKIFGLKAVANKIEKVINLDPLALRTFKEHSDLFMLDYVFNLNDATSANLYDQMIKTKFTWKELKLANPFIDSDQLKNQLVSDISDIEDLRHQDINLNPKDRRIDRVFMGSNAASTNGGSFKIGLNILRFENSHAYSQNKIASVDRTDKEKKFLLDTLTANHKSKFLFGLLGGEDETISTSVMFETDDNFKPVKFVTTTMSREIKFRSVSEGDYAEVQNMVKRVLPSASYNKIKWPTWNFNGPDPVNGFFRHDIYIHPAGVFTLPRLSSEDLQNRLIAIIKSKPYPNSGSANPFPDEESRGGWYSKYDYDINLISSAFMLITNPNESTERRYNAYIALKDIPLWREIGGGFLLSLLPKERFEELVGYQLTFAAKDQAPLNFNIGDLSQDELFRSIQYIQDTLNNRSFDLRLYSNDKGEFILKAPTESPTM